MAGIYRQRHPERTIFYRVFFHYFDSFLLEYENRFEREYGFLRPDDLLREIFTREVFSLLLRKKLINLTLIQKILRWRHTGFHVHSKVRATSKQEAERVGKYMIRPILSLKRLSFMAERPPPPRVLQQELLMSAEEHGEYF